ncbi:MAG: GMC oxidoreductase [Polyangiaceae bacterium]
MFTVRFKTTTVRPDSTVTLRNSVDGWGHDLGGVYEDDEWRFELDEQRYPNGAEFKFVLERSIWMQGQGNLSFGPQVDGAALEFDDSAVTFPPLTEVITENTVFQQRFFQPNLDEAHLYDVLVIGSGVGGGVVADQLADLGADVLVLEAGSALFVTHTANLPRQHQLGRFDKHLWALFDEFRIYNYVNAPGSEYQGAQAFNLGGRSVFWGGFIPRMTWWELEAWPNSVAWDLENFAYERAEELMYWPPPPSNYQQQVKSFLRQLLPDYDHFDAPMAVRQLNPAQGTLAPGLFSTADLLTEGRLSIDPTNLGRTTINLNHAVTRLLTGPDGTVTAVEAHDLVANKLRTYRARYVVLAAGTIESAKLAQLSALKDDDRLVGNGLTDHPVLFTHFAIPPGKPLHRVDSSSKTLSRHHAANADSHPYNVLIELGADLNQGRYLDPDTLARHRQLKGDVMLCEVVVLINSPLVAANGMNQSGPSYAKPTVRMARSPAADPHLPEVTALKDKLIQALGGEPLEGQDASLLRGALGGVAHEVGTLRMGPPGAGVVDNDLHYRGHDNLYVCDLSVFPTSPAANPTLTLAALALRLASHLKTKL